MAISDFRLDEKNGYSTQVVRGCVPPLKKMKWHQTKVSCLYQAANGCLWSIVTVDGLSWQGQFSDIWTEKVD